MPIERSSVSIRSRSMRSLYRRSRMTRCSIERSVTGDVFPRLTVSPRSRIDTGTSARGAVHHEVLDGDGSDASCASTPKWAAGNSPKAAAAIRPPSSPSASENARANRRKSARLDEAPIPTRDRRVRFNVSVRIAAIASWPSRSSKPLDLVEPFGHITDEHLGEQAELLGGQVVPTLPLVDRSEELRQLIGEGDVQIEHVSNGVGDRVDIAADRIESAEQLESTSQRAKPSGGYVAYFIDAGEHPFDQAVHFLAGAGDEVTVPTAVVVGEVRWIADGRGHREVAPPSQAFQSIGDSGRVDLGARGGQTDRYVVRRELREERPDEHVHDRPIVAPVLDGDVAEEPPRLFGISADHRGLLRVCPFHRECSRTMTPSSASRSTSTIANSGTVTWVPQSRSLVAMNRDQARPTTRTVGHGCPRIPSRMRRQVRGSGVRRAPTPLWRRTRQPRSRTMEGRRPSSSHPPTAGFDDSAERRVRRSAAAAPPSRARGGNRARRR